MAFEKLNILINDTHNIALSDVVKYTEQGSPLLRYTSSDDEYQNIIASELSFSMLVDNAEDARFFYLFTGNETRYEVQLEDFSDINNPVILWQGFLLPDTYSEPYENGSFFVQFTATDGLGRLKNKYLPADFYKDIKTIPQILCACLAQTGNTFHTVIAPAITNAAAVIKVKDLELDTTNFINNNKKQNAYEILEDLLTTMGCRLFQWKQTWYIIGINRMFDEVIPAEFYTVNGTYYSSGTNTITRNLKSVVFEASPNITAIPPFKTVIVDWDINAPDNAFRDDIVKQIPIATDLTYTPAYFTKVTGSEYFWHYLSYKGQFPSNVLDPLQTLKIPTEGPYFVSLYADHLITVANINQYYIQLTNPIYVAASFLKPEIVTLKITADIYMAIPVIASDLNELVTKIRYELTLNDTILMSNKPTFDSFNNYDFEYSVNGNNKITATLTVSELAITENGYIDIKLYPAFYDVTNRNTVSSVAFTSLQLKGFTTLVNELVKTRAIDFTTVKEVAINYGADISDLIKNKITIAATVPFTSSSYELVNQQITIPVLYSYQSNFVSSGNLFDLNFKGTYIIVTEQYFNLLQLYRNNIYIKRAATGEMIKMGWFIFLNYAGEVGIYQSEVEPRTDVFKIGDDLFIIIEDSVIVETDRHLLQQAWKRVGETENLNYLDALARIYHSTIPATKFKIEGSAFGLLTPLDVLQFQFRSPRNYNLSNLTMHLSEGMSSVLLIESLKENITDYE